MRADFNCSRGIFTYFKRVNPLLVNTQKLESYKSRVFRQRQIGQLNPCATMKQCKNNRSELHTTQLHKVCDTAKFQNFD